MSIIDSLITLIYIGMWDTLNNFFFAQAYYLILLGKADVHLSMAKQMAEKHP